MITVAENGVEVAAVTAAQMREIDRIAAEETGPDLFHMMENVGRNLAELAMELSALRARDVVLAGLRGVPEPRAGAGEPRHLRGPSTPTASTSSKASSTCPTPGRGSRAGSRR